MASIPAKKIVDITPSVVGTGGNGLELNGLILTSSDRVPIGAIYTFASASAVATFFGALSTEAALALKYFAGFNNSAQKPGRMLFAQYPTAAVYAYLQGADISDTALSIYQALSGTITLTVDGVDVTSANIDLSGITSLSEVASTVQTALANHDAVFTGAIAGTTLTVSAVTSGTLEVGQVIKSSSTAAGTKITALGSGTGGTGTYTVDTSQTVSSEAMTSGETTVEYDSLSGGFIIRGGTPGDGHTLSVAATSAIATAMGLTAAAGAYTSAAADAGTPASVMNGVVALTQNFASYMTAFKPSVDDMVAMAAWNSAQNNRYLYVMWDNDVTVTTQANTASAGYAIVAADSSGVFMLYDPVDGNAKAAFIMGTIASVDFARTEGRINLAFRSQSGLAAGVTDRTIADQLDLNGYNYYASFATANDEFTFLYYGRVVGPFLWADSYINQIWMTNAFQLALMNLLTTVRSIPYNPAGYALIAAALTDPIETAVTFGAIRAGVELSAAQAAQINSEAGVRIDNTITQFGWYLQVLPASAQVRGNRGSPPVTLWYADGQSVQRINMNSVEIQ